MNDILKQDIFFFVATIAVVILTILLAVLVVYIIRISRKVNYIADKAKQETDLLSGELTELRRNIRSSGFKLKHFTGFFGKIMGRSKK
jgi:hypothetical protein